MSEDIDEEKISGDSRVILEPEISIQKASKLYERLIAALEQNDEIEIDATEVKLIDTATLQLFVVFKQEVVKLHKHVKFIASERFIDSAKLLDLEEILELTD
jgi:ABC-type transporter Mla MlaB component